MSGLLIEAGREVHHGVAAYSFDAAFSFWIGASVLSMLLAATLWRVKVVD